MADKPKPAPEPDDTEDLTVEEPAESEAETVPARPIRMQKRRVLTPRHE